MNIPSYWCQNNRYVDCGPFKKNKEVVTTMASLSSSDHDWQVCVHMFCDYCSSPKSLDFTKQWFSYVCHWWSPRNEAFKSTRSDNAQKKMRWEWEDGCYVTSLLELIPQWLPVRKEKTPAQTHSWSHKRGFDCKCNLSTYFNSKKCAVSITGLMAWFSTLNG